MADGIKISVKDIQQFKADIALLIPAVQDKVDKFLNNHAKAIATKAKQNAPVDEGILKNSISAKTDTLLKKEIVVNTPYAAFVEFGTGPKAAQYVAGLPEDWQTFASQFRGQKGPGTFDDMVQRIAEWIGRKGIYGDTALHGTYSVKTHKRTGNKAKNKEADLALAYIIARSILIKGAKPHPYLYPAYKEEVEIMKREAQTLFKNL